MVKIRGPLLSLTARGWLGGDSYGKKNYNQQGWFYPKGVVHCPYPIALLPKIHIPYSMHAFTLRPWPPFISQYYSPMGWCYQRRRTWHGTVWAAIRPPVSKQPRTSIQQGYLSNFADAIIAWRNLTETERKIYNAYKYPPRMSGYNKYIRWYLKTHIAMPIFWGNLQRSGVDSDLISDEAVMQDNPVFRYPMNFRNYQAFNMVIHKGDGFPDSPVAGQLFYRQDEDKLYKFDGAAWEEVGAGGPGTDTRVATVIVAADDSGDYTDIQDGIDALPAAGGLVYVKNGTYNIDAALVIAKSNVVLQGQGAATIIHLNDSKNVNCLTIGDAASAYQDIIVKDLKIEGNKANQTDGYGIQVKVLVSRVNLEGVWIYQTKEDGILLSSGALYSRIYKCRIEETELSGLVIGGTENLQVELNQFINCGDEYNATIYHSTGQHNNINHNTIIHDGSATSSQGILDINCCWSNYIGNIIKGCYDGFYHNYSFFDYNNCNIINNEIYNAYRYGIYSPPQESIVTGNQITYSGDASIYVRSKRVNVLGNQISASSGDGIYVTGSNHNISNNNINICDRQGINLFCATGCKINANHIDGVSASVDNLYNGIHIEGAGGSYSKWNTIQDNILLEPTYGNRKRYAICEYNNIVDYNRIRGNRAGQSQFMNFYIQGVNSDAADNQELVIS